MESILGQVAGLGTSVCWTFTSVWFTAATRRIGPTAVNAVRIAIALVLLALTQRVLSGLWWPEMVPKQVFLLGLSGVIGLSLAISFCLSRFWKSGRAAQLD